MQCRMKLVPLLGLFAVFLTCAESARKSVRTPSTGDRPDDWCPDGECYYAPDDADAGDPRDRFLDMWDKFDDNVTEGKMPEWGKVIRFAHGTFEIDDKDLSFECLCPLHRQGDTVVARINTNAVIEIKYNATFPLLQRQNGLEAASETVFSVFFHLKDGEKRPVVQNVTFSKYLPFTFYGEGQPIEFIMYRSRPDYFFNNILPLPTVLSGGLTSAYNEAIHRVFPDMMSNSIE